MSGVRFTNIVINVIPSSQPPFSLGLLNPCFSTKVLCDKTYNARSYNMREPMNEDNHILSKMEEMIFGFCFKQKS